MTIDQLNEKYAVVGVGNKVVVAEFAEDGSVSELWPFEEFRKKLIKEKVIVAGQNARGNPTQRTLPLADFWLEHRQGRNYDRLVYAPPGSPLKVGPNDHNGWLGYAVAPIEGDWEKNKKHIHDIICDGDTTVYEWVMNWCAALVQEPGRHANTALVLRGGQGTGKGHFVDKLLGRMFNHHHYAHITGAGQLTGQFNEHLSGKCFVFADESTWGGDPRAAERLKAMITEDVVFIERKFLKGVPETSSLHIIIASNNDWPIHVDPKDRRFVMLDVSERQQQNIGYFGELLTELKSGGREAALFELLNREVDWEATLTPVTTGAKVEVSERSLSSVQRWWFEKLGNGYFSVNSNGNGNFKAELWPTTKTKMEVHGDYLEFLSKHEQSRRERRSTETELGRFLRDFADVRTFRPTIEGVRPWTFGFKNLDVCRKLWLLKVGWPLTYDWNPSDDEQSNL